MEDYANAMLNERKEDTLMEAFESLHTYILADAIKREAGVEEMRKMLKKTFSTANMDNADEKLQWWLAHARCAG